jgi:hypothetical protein
MPGGARSPWGRPIVPREMIAVLTQYTSGQAGFEKRAPFNETEGHQDQAPDEGHAARKAEELDGAGGAPAEPGKIEDAGGRQGIEGAAGVGHGDGQNRGEKQTGKTSGHFADKK